ncbi:MAG TPA: hypothetical protein VN132_12830, partial [Bdellovibrio sp.]|nr:hypothetical protein [Bdellovibrio sp.]
TKNFKKDGDSDQSSETIEVLGRAYLLIGYCQFQLKNHKEAEAAYSQAFALGEQSAGGNLARMYFWNQHDYKKTLNHLDVLFKNEYSKDGLELIDELRFLSYVMLGQGEEAKKQLMKPADDDMAIAPKVAIKSLEKLRKEMPTGSHLTLIDELLKMATELSAPKKFANDRDWWSSLPPFWKMYFESVLEIERDAQPTDKQLATVAAMETVEPPSRFKDPNKKGSLGGGIYPETLAPLSHLKKLRHLKVKSQKRWDLEPIAQCPELETLDLSESDLNDIAPLAKLSKLTELNIGKSDIENISALAHCKELKKLNIWKSGVSDLSPLVQCSKLEELLAGNIEARTLPLLKELKQLKRLELLFSYVPASEVEAFKEAHPGCEVKHSPKS